MGTVPDEVGGLTALVALWLYGNSLTGGISTELGLLGNLTLILYANDLGQIDEDARAGTIPSELGQLENIGNFCVFSNN